MLVGIKLFLCSENGSSARRPVNEVLIKIETLEGVWLLNAYIITRLYHANDHDAHCDVSSWSLTITVPHMV